jgi:hypothetical protein
MLEDAIDSLLSHSKTSTKRLAVLADYLKQQLAKEGLPNVRGGSGGELQVPGLSRTKNWDVAFEFAGKFRLLISLKSMLKNVSGSVPNRLDDLQGELANVQQLRPEIVIGYVVLFDLEGLWFVRFDSRKPKGQRLVSPRKAARDRTAFLTALLCELKLREPAIEFQR